MRLPTVTLRHKTKGTRLKVDQHEYARDLGKHKYRNYELVGEKRGDVSMEEADQLTAHQRDKDPEPDAPVVVRDPNEQAGDAADGMQEAQDPEKQSSETQEEVTDGEAEASEETPAESQPEAKEVPTSRRATVKRKATPKRRS
jgi:hypothetical protein